jgi:hypothetical protein
VAIWFVLACRLPAATPDSAPTTTAESDADADADTDSDIDSDTDADSDPGAFTGPPRVVVTAADDWKGRGAWALYDLQTLTWVLHGEAVDGDDLAPACSAAWVGVLRRHGQDGDGLDLMDGRYGTSLGEIELALGSQPSAAVGMPGGSVAIGFGSGSELDVRTADGKQVRTLDLAAYGDGDGTARVAALTWWRGTLLVVLDAGVLTDAMVVSIDPVSGAVEDDRSLRSATLSDEVVVVDGWLYVFGRGDALHPGGVEAVQLNTGERNWIDAEELTMTSLTGASFAPGGFWVAGTDDLGVPAARWVDLDGTVQHGFDLDGPVGDVAAESATAVWLTEGEGRTVQRRNAAGKVIGTFIFADPSAVRICGNDRL